MEVHWVSCRYSSSKRSVRSSACLRWWACKPVKTHQEPSGPQISFEKHRVTFDPWLHNDSLGRSASRTCILWALCINWGTYLQVQCQSISLIMISLVLWHIINQQNQNGRDCWWLESRSHYLGNMYRVTYPHNLLHCSSHMVTSICPSFFRLGWL